MTSRKRGTKECPVCYGRGHVATFSGMGARPLKKCRTCKGSGKVSENSHTKA